MGLPITPPADPRRRVRRARSSILSALATLFVLNAGLAAFVHYKPGFRDPLFDAKVKALVVRFTSREEPAKVVVFGSSRTAAAVEPRVLEEVVARRTGRPCVAFNMGVQGNGPVSQLVHYRRLRDVARVKPDVAVFELLPAAFAWYLDPSRHEDQPYDATILRPDRLTGKEVDTVCRYGFPDETRSEWREATFNPWSGFRFQLLARIEPKWLPPGIVQHRADIGETGGWGPWDPVPPAIRAQRVEEVRQAYGSQLHELRFDGPHVKAFEELLRECRQDGVRVIVVAPPEGSEFRSLYPPEARQELTDFEERLRHEFGICVLDASEWLPDDAFADSHHVLRAYAGPYTRRLAVDAVVPALTDGSKH